MDRAADEKNPDEGQSTAAALPLRPHFAPTAPGAAGAPRRVIRKMVVLDPNKIQKLALEQKIIQAVAKLKDSKAISSKNMQQNILHKTTTKIITDSAKTPIVPHKKTDTIAAAPLELKPIIESSEKILQHPKEPEVSHHNLLRKLSSAEVKTLLNKTLLDRAQYLKKRSSATKILHFTDNDSEKTQPIEITKPLDRSPDNESNPEPVPFESIEQKLKNRLDEINFTDAFIGFADHEIKSDRNVLERLSVLIEKSKLQSTDRIPSFSNLKTYLTHKKFAPIEEDNKSLSSDRSSTDSSTSDNSPAGYENIATDIELNNELSVASESDSISCSKDEKIDVPEPVASSSRHLNIKPPRRRPIPATILKLGKRSASVSSSRTSKPIKIDPKTTESQASPEQILSNSTTEVAKQTNHTFKIDEINLNTIIHPAPINTVVNRTSPSSLSDKGIIVLDQKVYKPGIPIPSFLTGAELIPNRDLSAISIQPFLTNREVSSNPGISLSPFLTNTNTTTMINDSNSEIYQYPKISFLNDTPASTVPNRQANQNPTERTIILKVLNRDPVSNDIQLEVVDPLLNMEQPKKFKTNPTIKNICKSYVKKMLKTTGIKQIQINSTCDSNPMPRPYLFNAADYADRGSDQVVLRDGNVQLENESQSVVSQPIDYQNEEAGPNLDYQNVEKEISFPIDCSNLTAADSQDDVRSKRLENQGKSEIGMSKAVAEIEVAETIAEMQDIKESLGGLHAAEPIAKIRSAEPVAETEAVGPVAEFQTIKSIAEIEDRQQTLVTQPIEPIAEIQDVEPVAETQAVEPVDEFQIIGSIAEMQDRRQTLVIQPIEPIAEIQASEPIAETQAVEPVDESQTIESIAEIEDRQQTLVIQPIEPIAEIQASEPIAETQAVEPFSEFEIIKPIAELQDMQQTVKPIAEIQTAEPVTGTELSQTIESITELPDIQQVPEIQPITKIQAVEPGAEMDAVEYILSCSKNNRGEYDKISGFEDEDDTDWDDNDDFDDESDYDDGIDNNDEPMADDTHSQSSDSEKKLEDGNNTIPSTAEKQVNSQNQPNPLYEFAVSPDIISLIQQAEITFESEIEPAPPLLSVIDLSRGITQKNAAAASYIVASSSTTSKSTDDQINREVSIQPVSNCSQEISASVIAEISPNENQVATISKESNLQKDEVAIKRKDPKEGQVSNWFQEKCATVVADVNPNENQIKINHKEPSLKEDQVAVERKDLKEGQVSNWFQEKSATVVADVNPTENQVEINLKRPNQDQEIVAPPRTEPIVKRSRKRTILDYMVSLKSDPVPKTRSIQDEQQISEEPKFTGEKTSCILAAVELQANRRDPSTVSSKKMPSSMKPWSKIVQNSLYASNCDEADTTTSITPTTQTELNQTNNTAIEGNSEEIISNSTIETILNSRSLDGSIGNKMKFCSTKEKNLSFLDSASKRAKIRKDLEKTTNKEETKNEMPKIHDEPSLDEPKLNENTDQNIDEIIDANETEIGSNDIVAEADDQESSTGLKENNSNYESDENLTESTPSTSAKDCHKETKKKSKKKIKNKKKITTKTEEKKQQQPTENITLRRRRTRNNSETHSDGKSNRIRKPIIKSGFVMETKDIRKESNNPKNSTKSVEMKSKTLTVFDFGIKRIDPPIAEVTPTNSNKKDATTTSASTTPKITKSRRKNTIPEIDKLALERKSRNTISESEEEIRGDKQSNVISEPIVSTASRNESTDNSFPKPNKPTNKSKTVAGKKVAKPSPSHEANIQEKPKKRTKRKRRVPSENYDNNEAAAEEEEEGEDDFNPKRVKTDPEPPTKIVWRKKAAHNRKTVKGDCFIHPKLLLVENRSELNQEFDITIEEEKIGGATIKIEPEEHDNYQDLVQCGTCKQIVNEKIFAEHLKRHFGVGWREGKDAPINLSSYREVLNAMVYFMKMNKIQFFNCKFCGEMKKSAIGVMGHIQTCQLSQAEISELLETCEVCGKRYAPFFMLTHAKSCKAPSLETENKQDEVHLDSNGRVKRQSLLKANSSFKDIMNSTYKLSVDDLIKPYLMPRGGISIKWRTAIKRDGKAKCYESKCSYESSDLDELKTHVKSCTHIRRGGFCCVRCKFYNINRDAVYKHIEKKHQREFNALMPKEPDDDKSHADDSECDLGNENSDNDSESSGLEEYDENMDSERDNSIKQKAKTGLHFMNFNHRVPLKVRNFVQCTELIRKKIYTDEILYPKAFAHDISILDESFDSYKPANHTSMKFNFNLKSKTINKPIGSSAMPNEWFEMDAFESNFSEDGGMIFIGGPITTLAWAPMPALGNADTSEYLAVSYKFNYDTHIMTNTPEQYKSLILVYKIDMKKVSKKSGFQSKPELLYALSCIGPIHHLVFLPSGGYAPEINRLGLLAVASVQSKIEIFALPIKAPENCDTNSHKIVNLIDIKPSLVLCLELSDTSSSSRDYMAQCTRIVWSEIKNHNIIGAGFSNGFVGIWDIRDENNLTKFEGETSSHFVPLSYFRAIQDSVTGLEFHYNLDGPKWLAVTSHIRELRSYDLDDMTIPLLVCQDQAQKSSLSDILWPIYSENPIISMSDDYVEDSCTALARSLLNVTYKVKHNLHSPTGINSLTFSPWHNALIGACDNGDIVLQKYKTVSMENICANAYAKRYVYYTDIIRLDGQKIPNVDQKTTKGNLSDAALASLESFENDYKEKYGIIFGGPAIAYARTNKDAQSLTRVPPFSLRPLTRVKCIKLCPNITNNNVLAVGYNNGFVRIKLMDFRDLV